MENGPTGGYRRTAGEGRIGDDTIREWQQDTWSGPDPGGNPFEEPEDAPELRDSRSPNVTEHVGDFWNTATHGYSFETGAGLKQGKRAGDVNEKKGQQPNRKNSKLFRWALGGLAISLAVVLILHLVVFRIRTIVVTGNRELSAEQVIGISGIHPGDSILTLNENTVRERIEADYRLQFRFLAKTLPSGVSLAVREREDCCYLTYGGILYSIDKSRMVMFESEMLFEPDQDGTSKPLNPNDPETVRVAEERARVQEIRQNLVEVKGLNIRSGCRVGQRLALFDAEQQNAFHSLFLELRVINCIPLILEADLSNPTTMLLQTRDGYTVILGNRDSLHAKLRSMLMVRQELMSRGFRNGTINVSNPESPLYSPSAS